jgi:glycosyltransferase involved in cell wall biosynthesis
MKFSICIPTLNEEKYIGVLLNALCRQTFKDFEVIIADGRSTDKTLQVVHKYAQKLNLKVVVAGQKGVSRQRNLAASQAIYNHLVFFDADVDPIPTFLEQLAQKIHTQKFTAATSWNEPISDKMIDQLIYNTYNLFYLEGLKKISPSATGTFIYVTRQAFFKVKGFNEKVNIAEDYDLIRRLFKAGYKFEVLKEPKIHFSVRRLDKHGRLRFIADQLRAGYYYHTHGTNHPLFRSRSDWHPSGHFT